MTEGPERRAAGPRSPLLSEAAGDLELSSHDWRGLIEQLPLAVYIDRLDEWSSNLYLSPQIEAVLGYTTEEWAAEDHLLLRVLHPDDRERVIAAHRRSCEGMAKAGTLAGAAELVARVDEEFARATEALQAAVQGVT